MLNNLNTYAKGIICILRGEQGQKWKNTVNINASSENKLKLSEYQQILAWYEQMGVDSAIGETPVNWFETENTIDQSLIRALTMHPATSTEKHRVAPAPAQKNSHFTQNQHPAENGQQQKTEISPSHTPAPQTTAPLAQPSLELAKKLASQCNSLNDLQQALTEFDGCGLKRTAKNLVFYRGAEQADIMIIGEAPGRDEDIVGKPFVGKAGQLLDRMLKSINLDEQTTHITNIVYWRPPGNRTPTSEEGHLCRPFLNRQVELVQPKMILLLGGAAAKQIFNTVTGITKLRGSWKPITYNSSTVPTIATLHPAYLLRTPIAKKMVWQDLQQLAQKREAG